MTRFRKLLSTPIASRFLMVLFGLAMGFVLVEFAIRILDPYPYTPPWEKNHSPLGTLMQFDPILGWRGLPDRAEWFIDENAKVWVEHNHAGFRDIDLSERSPDKPAVVFLGDSFTWGYEVDYDEMFVTIVREGLEDREVFNLSHRGYGTDQSLLVFREWDEASDIELVILMFSENDFRDNESKGHDVSRPKFEIVDDALVLSNVPLEKVDKWDAPLPQPGSPDGIVDFARQIFLRSHLLHELNFRRRLLLYSVPADILVEDSLEGPPLELSRRLLQQLKEDVERRNGQLIVVAIPSKAQFMGLDGFVPYQVHLRAICQEFGIEFLDLAPHFERTFLRTYFREGIHLNARGHEVAGEAIGEYLQAREGR